MADTMKLADVMVSVKLDTTAFKKQIAQLSRQTPQIAQNNKAVISGLQREIALKRSAMRLDQARERVLSGVSRIAMRGAVGAVGGVTYGFAQWLKTADPAARKFNGTLLKLKSTANNVFANIAKQADIKFGISDKMVKLTEWLSKLTKADLNRFLDVTKMAILVAGFTKIWLMVKQIGDVFQRISIARLVAQKAGGSTLGTALGAGIGARFGASSGVRSAMMPPRLPLSAKDFVAKILSSSSTQNIDAPYQGRFAKKAFAMRFDPTGRTLGMRNMEIGKRGLQLADFGDKVKGVAGRGLSTARGGIASFGTLGGAGVVGAVTVAFAGLFGLFKSEGAGVERLNSALSESARLLADMGDILVIGLVSPIIAIIDIIKKLGPAVGNLISGNPVLAVTGALQINKKFKGSNPFAGAAGTAKEAFDRMEAREIASKIIKVKGDKSSLDKFGVVGGSVTGGLTDLPKMFQDMFDQNVQANLIQANISNTDATKNNTLAVERLSLGIAQFRLNSGASASTAFSNNGVNNGLYTTGNSVLLKYGS